MDTPNYSEAAASGISWIRANRVEINNPYGGTPYLQIYEEKIFSLEGEIVNKPYYTLLVSFDINNLLHLQLYDTMNQIYIEERTKRDTPPI